MEVYLCEGIARREQVYDLLALAVREHWGLSSLPALGRGEQGKPFFPQYPQYHFSLSHSGALALCALDGAPVGADVERVRPHHPHLPGRICNPEELAWLRDQPDLTRALCRLWVLKECRVKYTGTGLTVPLRSIPIPLPPPAGEWVRQDGLYFAALEGGDWCASLCGHSPPGPLRRVSPDKFGPGGGNSGSDLQSMG